MFNYYAFTVLGLLLEVSGAIVLYWYLPVMFVATENGNAGQRELIEVYQAQEYSKIGFKLLISGFAIQFLINLVQVIATGKSEGIWALLI